MRWVVPLLVVAAVLEAAAIQGFVAYGPHPEISLVIVIAWATLRGWQEGLLVGLIGGLLVDALSAAPFGLHTVRLGLLGCGAGLVLARLAQGSVLLPVAAAACGSLAGFVYSVFALQAAGWVVAWERALVASALPSALFAAAGMAVGYPALRALHRRDLGEEDGREV